MARTVTRPGHQTKRTIQSGGRTTRTTTSKVSAPGKPQTSWKTTTASATLGTTNSAVAFVSKVGHLTGSHGAPVRVRIVVSGASTPLSVAVSGNDITINSATNGSSVATTTALQARDAVNQNSAARDLVDSYLPATSNGSGVVAAAGFTALT